MRLIKKIAPALTLLLFLTQLITVYAGTLPRTSIGVPACGAFGCSLCHLFELVSNVIDFLITLIFPAAAAVVAYGAILIIFSGGSPQRVESGKHAVKTAVIGILIALLSWTIISVVLAIATGGKAVPWNQINC